MYAEFVVVGVIHSNLRTQASLPPHVYSIENGYPENCVWKGPYLGTQVTIGTWFGTFPKKQFKVSLKDSERRFINIKSWVPGYPYY